MRVIGIDPGSRRLGWGVIEIPRGSASRMVHVASGTLRVDGDLVQRLRDIADALDALLVTHSPQAAAVESIFHAKNSQSALILGHARGVALLSLARSSLPVFEYTPGQIKQAATGHGRADKGQVQTMVHLLLGLPPAAPKSSQDTSDALAAAICHAQLHTSWLHGHPGAAQGVKR